MEIKREFVPTYGYIYLDTFMEESVKSEGIIADEWVNAPVEYGVFMMPVPYQGRNSWTGNFLDLDEKVLEVVVDTSKLKGRFFQDERHGPYGVFPINSPEDVEGIVYEGSIPVDAIVRIRKYEIKDSSRSNPDQKFEMISIS